MRPQDLAKLTNVVGPPQKQVMESNSAILAKEISLIFPPSFLRVSLGLTLALRQLFTMSGKAIGPS